MKIKEDKLTNKKIAKSFKEKNLQIKETVANN